MAIEADFPISYQNFRRLGEQNKEKELTLNGHMISLTQVVSSDQPHVNNYQSTIGLMRKIDR